MKTGIGVQVISCPHCITNSEDNRNRDDSDATEIKDTTKIIGEVI
jgi:hypothetical protein